MKTALMLLALAAAPACRDSPSEKHGAPKLVNAPFEAGPNVEPVRDALPRLPAERAEFWAQWIGERPGAPGPKMIAWCDDPKSADRFLEKALSLGRERDTCSLVAWSDELRAEARIALAVWNGGPWYDGKASGTWIDEVGKWTATIVDGDTNPLGMHWRRHVDVEEVLGTNGRLLRDLDVESLVGKKPTALKDAIRPPYAIARCDNDACSVLGPALPGGEPVQVFIREVPKGMGVTITSSEPRKLHMRIAQSIGPEDPTAAGVSSRHVHRHGGVRYDIDVSLSTLTILVSPDNSKRP